jgi:FkbH-like protein
LNKEKFKCVLISDFNTDVFSGYLSNDEDMPAVDASAAPFGQVIPLLMQDDLAYWKGSYDFTVIWTRPEGVIKSFKDLLAGSNNSVEVVLSEVDLFASLIINMCSKVQAVFMPTWVLPPFYRGLGMLDMKKDLGIANTLMQMNLRLAANFEQYSNIYLLDVQKWINTAGKYAVNPRLWYRGKIAFGNDVCKEAVKDIKSALRGLQGNAKKIVILDLDNTLWGGVVGDVGWENIVLGGHDPEGEAYADFQTALKSLTNRGLLLGIISKNEEAAALEAINKHPEMVLRLKDFAGWKINWQDKAQNIVDLMSELNLGLQSAVFIDDNPAERARVRDTLSEVLVPDWPDDSMLYVSALHGLRCFDNPTVSKEDNERTRMYINDQQRNALQKSLSSLDDWLRGLEIKIKIEELNEVNLQRTVQLLNKTNQMNLSTRRMTERELLDWVKGDNRKLWTFRVSDKFGDSGLTGIMSLEVKNDYCQMADFVLSCRVIGRKIEETMLFTAIKYAGVLGLKSVKAEYIPTPKNKPCLDFWEKSGFQINENGRSFTWDLKNEYALPHQIEVVRVEN